MNLQALIQGGQPLSLVVLCLFLLSACDKEPTPVEQSAAKVVAPKAEAEKSPAATPPSTSTPVAETETETANTQLDIGNTQYLFIAAEHTPEELQPLLKRVEEVTQSGTQLYDALDIALVIHGKNIDMFTQKNYEQSK